MSSLKELYNLKIDESGLNTGLTKWYNNVINKTYEQLNVSDVAKMYRQDIMLDLALERAIDLVVVNPYDGEYNNGGLMELIATFDLNQMNCEKIAQLESLIEKILDEYTMFEWCTDEEKIKFKNNIDLLKTRIKRDCNSQNT